MSPWFELVGFPTWSLTFQKLSERLFAIWLSTSASGRPWAAKHAEQCGSKASVKWQIGFRVSGVSVVPGKENYNKY